MGENLCDKEEKFSNDNFVSFDCNKSGEKVLNDSVVYVPENIAYTTDLDNIYSSCVVGDTMYLIGTGSDLTIPPKLLRLPLTGGEAEALPEYQPALKGGNIVFLAPCLRAGTDGTLWVSEMIGNVQPWQLTREATKAEGSGTPQYGEALVLRQLDREGKELFRFSAMQSELEERLNLGAIYSKGLLVDGDGTVYVNCEKGIAVLDGSGAASFTLQSKDPYGSSAVFLGSVHIRASTISAK